MEVDQHVVAVRRFTPDPVVPFVEVLIRADLDSAAELRVLSGRVRNERQLGTFLPVDEDAQAGEDRAGGHQFRRPVVVGEAQFGALDRKGIVFDVNGCSGPAVVANGQHLALRADRERSWCQAEQSDSRGIFTELDGVVPTGTTKVEELLKLFDPPAVVTDSDETVPIGYLRLGRSGTPGVLQDFYDPAFDGTREQPACLLQQARVHGCLDGFGFHVAFPPAWVLGWRHHAHACMVSPRARHTSRRFVDSVLTSETLIVVRLRRFRRAEARECRGRVVERRGELWWCHRSREGQPLCGQPRSAHTNRGC